MDETSYPTGSAHETVITPTGPFVVDARGAVQVNGVWIMNIPRVKTHVRAVRVGHFWTISTVHIITDPEQALDEMNLDRESFIGVSAIRCLYCTAVYARKHRHEGCSGAL